MSPSINPTARPFCAYHPDGVRCQYCASRAIEAPCTGRDRHNRAQRLLKEAKAAQVAYWDAMAQLEGATNLELDWSDCDLTEYTLSQLRDEFPAKKSN